MATEERPDAEMADGQDETTTTTTAPPRKPAAPVKATERPMPDDPQELQEELRKAREALTKGNKEAEVTRRRLRDLEQAEEQRSQATLTEAEKVRKAAKDAETARVEAERRAVDAEATLERTKIDMAVERAALAMGFEYPDIVPSLIDRSRITTNEDTGKPEGIKEALERLAKERPGLIDAAPRGGSPPREGPRRPARGEKQPDIETELRSSGNYV